MKPKFIGTVVSTLLMVACVMAPARKAHADEPSVYAPFEYNTLRLEPGFAAPLNSPQTDHYHVGAAVSAKLDLHITPWVSVFPSVSLVALSIGDKPTAGGDIGTAWSYGLGLRIERPHDYTNNPDHGLAAFSPWIDGEPVYVRTASLNRFGLQAAAGVYFPTSDSRWLWTGPFVGYQEIVDGTSFGGDATKDHTDSRVGILGWGFEFDFAGHHENVPVTQPEKKNDVPETVVTEVPQPAPPPPAEHDVKLNQTLEMTVTFDFDSSDLSDEYKHDLSYLAASILRGINNHPDLTVEIDGHASDEHHPWAAEHNQRLSEERAQAVKDFLVEAGVSENTLTVKGFGTSQPIDTNDTAEGRAHNRRVEFVVSVTLHCTEGEDCK